MTPGTERAVRQVKDILRAVGTQSAQTYAIAGLPLSWMTLRELVDAVARAEEERASRQDWASEAMRLDVENEQLRHQVEILGNALQRAALNDRGVLERAAHATAVLTEMAAMAEQARLIPPGDPAQAPERAQEALRRAISHLTGGCGRMEWCEDCRRHVPHGWLATQPESGDAR